MNNLMLQQEVTDLESDEEGKGEDVDTETSGARSREPTRAVEHDLNRYKFHHLCSSIESDLLSPPPYLSLLPVPHLLLENICSNFLSPRPTCSSTPPKYQPKILSILGCILHTMPHAYSHRIGLAYSACILQSNTLHSMTKFRRISDNKTK